jgi:hypothetical protein
MQHPAFTEGHFDTKFIETYFKPELLDNNSESLNQASAYMSGFFYNKKNKTEAAQQTGSSQVSNWQLKRK